MCGTCRLLCFHSSVNTRGNCMVLQNVVVAVLVQGAFHSVHVTDPGSSKTDPDHQASCSIFDSWCHTLRNHLFTEPKISNFDSSVPNTFSQSSVVHWWCFLAQTGFLIATWPVKPAVQSLLFTVETETCLLRSLLSCLWSCCPVGCLSHKLLTLRNLFSDSVLALGLPDLFLSFCVPFADKGNCTH